MEITIEPDFEQQARCVSGPAFHSCRHRQAQRGQIQLIDKLPQEPGGMVGRHPIFQGRRKKKLLSVIGSDRLNHDDLINLGSRRSKILYKVLRQSRNRRPTSMQIARHS